MIDWGTLPGGVKVFCAVLAWCRFRFVRFARDETAATTMALLAECFETLGGVPAKVLADRMGCLKGGTVSGVVIPTPDYVRFSGVLGATLGLFALIGVAVTREWTPTIQPATLLLSPVIGVVTGTLAGLIPALRASRTPPADTLRT